MLCVLNATISGLWFHAPHTQQVLIDNQTKISVSLFVAPGTATIGQPCRVLALWLWFHCQSYKVETKKGSYTASQPDREDQGSGLRVVWSESFWVVRI